MVSLDATHVSAVPVFMVFMLAAVNIPTDRIRDTLIHEMCHAATWLIDGTKKAGHGPLWKAW